MSIALSLSIYIGLGLAIAMLVAPHQVTWPEGAVQKCLSHKDLHAVNLQRAFAERK